MYDGEDLVREFKKLLGLAWVNAECYLAAFIPTIERELARQDISNDVKDEWRKLLEAYYLKKARSEKSFILGSTACCLL